MDVTLSIERKQKNLDFLRPNPYTDNNRTRHASDFIMRNPAGLSILVRYLSMNPYPKRILTIPQQLHRLLFGMATNIEVALRARLSDALLTYRDALILMDPAVFSDKKLFWQNLSSLSSQIARSNDVFICHNFQKHDGEIPLWAAVEVMSFGTLSKTIKNMKTGKDSAYSVLANYYRYCSPRGKFVKPSLRMLSSWIQSVSVLRNMCAHNSRIYNRTINTFPELLIADQLDPRPSHNGLYQILLAMKYLRPTDNSWRNFYAELQTLFHKYSGSFDLNCMNFPSDWTSHLALDA